MIAIVQDRPVCFHCDTVVETGAVFAPPYCDHLECSSAVFHGLCLMEWREHLEALRERARQAQERHDRGECSCPIDDDKRQH